MKVLYKPKKEQWDMFSLRLRVATHDKLKEIRQVASEKDLDINGMLDAAVMEVVNTVMGAAAGPSARTNSYTNGSTKAEE